MGLKSRMYELTAIEEVNEFMEKFPTGAFFKAGGCHKTMQGFGYVEQALDARDNIHVGFVRVIECRPVSNYIAEIMQITHQSPQLILFINRMPVYDVDNWNITLPALEAAFLQFLGPVALSQKFTPDSQSLPPVTDYIRLLQKMIQGQISESEFRQHWLMTFQSDATPRSTKQFDLLNSLFGDVDMALSSAPSDSSSLKDRAELLLKALSS